MYLDPIADAIKSFVPPDRMPDEEASDLFRLYAVLLLAKGTSVTQSDIHDAWSAWMTLRDENHKSLVPYEYLDTATQVEDAVFVEAVRKAAKSEVSPRTLTSQFASILFPAGPPTDEIGTQQTFDLYKIMVDSSERLVSRRQAVNTFFLTMNGALLTASGIIVQSSGSYRLTAMGVAVLAVAGIVLCLAWRSLIVSFGQLNRGKFKVINTIEGYLTAAIYAAEWEALGRGEDPAIYRSFTSREIWVPNALLCLHIIVVIASFLWATGAISVTP